MNRAKRVIILDDENLVATSNADILAEAGYDVVGVASRAEAALAQARSSPPDLAVLDINLKAERDGIDAALALREICNPAILFVSGQLDADTRARVAAMPWASFLLKPFWPESLIRAAKDALARHATLSRNGNQGL